MAGLLRPGASRAAESAAWQELEGFLGRVAANGERSLSFAEVERMGALYRVAAARLAAAQRSDHDRRRRAYLESLVQRGHFVMYPPRSWGWAGLRALLLGGFARAFRRDLRLQAVALGLLVVGAVVGYIATLQRVELAYPLVGMMYPPDLLQALIESEEARRDFLSAGQGSGAGIRTAFAAGLVANNARVAFAAFALGVAAGVPTVLIQTFNGALLGSFAAIFARGDSALLWWAWVLPHAVVEIPALCIAAAAGLGLGLALIRPGVAPRREALAAAGRRAAVLIGLAVVLLSYAAVVEAYFRQSSLGSAPRLGLAAVNLLVVVGYLGLAGRSSPRRCDRPGAPL